MSAPRLRGWITPPDDSVPDIVDAIELLNEGAPMRRVQNVLIYAHLEDRRRRYGTPYDTSGHISIRKDIAC